MIPRVYIDTSVFGGYFDDEFKIPTEQFFSKIFKKDFSPVCSIITIDEISKAPKHIKELYNKITNLEIIEINEEIIELADHYITEKVIGKTNRADCLHIACATVSNLELLVSWNFNHIVNWTRIRGFNSVNLKNGYKFLEIRTPEEVLDYE